MRFGTPTRNMSKLIYAMSRAGFAFGCVTTEWDLSPSWLPRAAAQVIGDCWGCANVRRVLGVGSNSGASVAPAQRLDSLFPQPSPTLNSLRQIRSLRQA